ncbi:hypothetical protein GTY68_01575 [Streptomyces sp. SID4926]|nr:conserved hypothetical protein [Streptomyces sp. SPB78]MYQ55961.1 hypothetical protein [Streptomyces sp. SID4926]
MPSLTVVVSSDTDICFSPGLYGDCLPTFQPARSGSYSRAATDRVLSSSHTPPGRVRGREGAHITSGRTVSST